MDSPFIIIVVVGILLVIVFAILGHLQAVKRRKALQEWATQRGFRFRADKDRRLERRYAMFSCLKKGSARYGYNFIEGELKDRRLCAFDYHYETYSTNSKGQRQTHHHYFSALVLEVNLPLEPLFIRPENVLDKVGAFLGFDDINFESAEFSRKFHVTAPNRRWAYDVLHQEAIEFLLHAPVFNLEFQDRCVIAYRNRTFALVDFEAALDVAGGLLDRLPKSVLRELKEVD